MVDAWEFEATLGIALMVQNRKLVSLASPFHHQFKQPATPGDSTEDMASSGSPPIDSLVVLDVDASDLVRSGLAPRARAALLGCAGDDAPCGGRPQRRGG
jgi:hypothetical protein